MSHDPNRPQIGASSQLSSNDKMKKRLEEKVAANRKDLGSKNKENKNSVKKGIKVAISSIYPRVFHFFTIFEFQNAWGPYRWYFG